MEITGAAAARVPVAYETTAHAAIAAERRELLRAVNAANAAQMFGVESQLQFQTDPETERVLIRLVDSETGEIVMQIPDEYLLRMAEELQKQSR